MREDLQIRKRPACPGQFCTPVDGQPWKPVDTLCYELRKFVQVADFVITKETPLEAILHQLKLGMEVMAPHISAEYMRRSELRLQREIARFLIERGIYAVGTKFGRYETDFAIGGHTDHYVVEVKKCAEGQAITDRTVKAALVQLQSYMDEPPTHPLGILLIFNFTDSLLIAPPTWIRGRYKILAVNLQRDPPSGRTKSLTVEEGSGADTIRVHVIDGAGKRRKQRPGGSRARGRR